MKKLLLFGKNINDYLSFGIITKKMFNEEGLPNIFSLSFTSILIVLKSSVYTKD
jgi:hypothetical protein